MTQQHSTPSVSLWETAKFYLKMAFKRPLIAIAPFILSGVGTILVLFVPNLFIANILAKLQHQELYGDLSIFLQPLAWMIALAFIGEVLWRFALHFMDQLDSETMQDLANMAFDDLVNRPLSFHAENFAGALVNKVNRFSKNFETFYDTMIFNVWGFVVTFLFAGVILISRSPWTIIGFVVISFVYVLLVRRPIRIRSRMVAKRSAMESDQTAALADALTNITAIKSFARESDEKQHFSDVSKQLQTQRFKSWEYNVWHIDTITAPAYILINGTAVLASILAATRWHVRADVVFLSFTFFAQLSRNLWDFGRVYRNFESGLSEAGEMLAIMRQPHDLTDPANPVKPHMARGKVEIKHMSFKHSGSKKLLFDDVNLRIQPGEKIGLVGHSGSGKTTITKLILRFMDINAGQILIDGQDIQEVRQAELRDHIAYVPQEPLLFHRSLLENIRYGNMEADDQAVHGVAKLAHASDFIDDLPEKYETLVGERGVKLSGGQRQRVAIARAMLKNAPILILDEATSALDSESEDLIQDALWKLMQNRTAIVIAHRLSTIQRMDRIIVLENGRIVEEGSHRELIKHGRVYADLWNRQSGGFIED